MHMFFISDDDALNTLQAFAKKNTFYVIYPWDTNFTFPVE